MAGNPNIGLNYVPGAIPLISSSSDLVQRNSTLKSDRNEASPPRKYPSHDDAPEMSPSARTLCEILVRASPNDVESALTASGVLPSPELVQEVLKFSYGYPSAAIKFFRWAGVSQKHTAYSWNLMVDLLGKNQIFDPMWAAIRSMKQEEVLSLPTFVSVFESYCISGRFKEAVMSFDVMENYGIQQDVVAVNSLLSAICREDNQTTMAWEFFEKIKEKIPPDGDTFAILLEGWDKESNLQKSKSTLDEMVVRIGWSPKNMPTYEAFFMTLVRASQAEEVVELLRAMKQNNCLPGMKFFSDALDFIIRENDVAHAISLWDIMVDGGLAPNLIMCNAMIGLLCNKNRIDDAFELFDGMIFHGAFPDSLSYNMIFGCLIKNRKVHDASKFFLEMLKNEFPPTHPNCAAAIAVLFEGDDPEAAFDIWYYMVQNHVKPIDDSANALLVGLANLGRLSELKRFAEDMLHQRIRIDESTMEILRTAFYKQGTIFRDKYDSLRRKWKALLASGTGFNDKAVV